MVRELDPKCTEMHNHTTRKLVFKNNITFISISFYAEQTKTVNHLNLICGN